MTIEGTMIKCEYVGWCGYEKLASDMRTFVIIKPSTIVYLKKFKGTLEETYAVIQVNGCEVSIEYRFFKQYFKGDY